MRIAFNDKFSYSAFREDLLNLHENIHCLTFQTREVLDIIKHEGIYKPDSSKSIRQSNQRDYERITKELGFMPIWVFNPLQFGDSPQITWKDEWFNDGSLWNRLLEDATIPKEEAKYFTLLEISVNPINLYPDPVFDYGYISVTDKIEKKDLLGYYTLVYPDQESNEWLYPWLYPGLDNSMSCSFPIAKQYMKNSAGIV